jgi:predicted ester cyclase
MLAAFVLPVAAQDDATQANKDAVRNALAAYSAGDPGPFHALIADPFMMNQGGPILEQASVADVQGYDAAIMGAIPDLQWVPNVIIAQGDWVAMQSTYTGNFTNTLDFFGEQFPATNQPVMWTELDFVRFNADGQIIEVWVIADPAAQFSQLGIFPADDFGPPTGTPLESPAGYQALSADELTATFVSGMEERNIALELEQFDLTIDPSPYFTDPFVSWNAGLPYSITAAQQQDDAAFPQMIAAAMPDYTINADVLVAEGDWVAALVTVSGTFTGDVDFFGTPLAHNDQNITWQLGIIDRYDADGKIAEEWFESDITPLFVGLGLMPPMEE